MRRIVLILVASLFSALFVAGSSAPAEPGDDCTWGASSVLVEKVHGQYIQRGPVTTGCIPTAP